MYLMSAIDNRMSAKDNISVIVTKLSLHSLMLTVARHQLYFELEFNSKVEDLIDSEEQKT